MNKTIRLFGFTALVAVIVFSMTLASCSRVRDARNAFTAVAEVAKALEAEKEAVGGGSSRSGSSSIGIGGTLTITGLPNGGYAVYILKVGTDISTSEAASSAIGTDVQAVGGMNDASSSNNVFAVLGTNSATGAGILEWTASGRLPVLLLNTNAMAQGDFANIFFYATVNFTNGVGTVRWSDFKVVAMQ